MTVALMIESAFGRVPEARLPARYNQTMPRPLSRSALERLGPLKDENKIAQQTVDQMLRLVDEIAAAEMSDSAPPMTLVAMELLNSALAWLRARPKDA